MVGIALYRIESILDGFDVLEEEELALEVQLFCEDGELFCEDGEGSLGIMS